jgi:hypothetical protein
MIGNDLPQQGGITGRMPYDPNVSAMGMQFPGIEATPPPMNIPGTLGVGQEPDPRIQPMFSVGPYEPQQFDLRSSEVDMPTPGQGIPSVDAGQRMRELYNPSDDASRRFEEAIGQYPQQKRPGWLQGIGSLLQEFAYGPNVADRTRQKWREEPIEDWKNKIGPMQQAATNERYQNVNDRTMAYNQMSIELREQAQLAKERNDERKAAIQQQRADIYAFKAMHPNFKFLMPKGGNVQAMDPATGQAHDTGIPTGSMTQLDQMWLTQEQALERISATGEEARETEGVRQTGRMEVVTERGKQARDTKATPSGSATGKDLLPTQKKVEEFRRARELANTRPDLAPFIKLGSANEYDLVKPNPGAWTQHGKGPTPQQYSDMVNAVYGSAVGGRNAGAGPGPKAITSYKGTVKVRSKTDSTKTGTFQGTEAEAIAAGYQVVK